MQIFVMHSSFRRRWYAGLLLVYGCTCRHISKVYVSSFSANDICVVHCMFHNMHIKWKHAPINVFILYINYICNVSQLFLFVLFANVTNVLYSDANIRGPINVANYEIENKYTWFGINKLSLNVSKPNYVIFCKCRLIFYIDVRNCSNQTTWSLDRLETDLERPNE